MSAPRQRLSGRDYKHAGRRDGGLPLHYRTFAAGLALGLAVAAGVYLIDRGAAPATEPLPQPRSAAKPSVADASATESDEASAQYDFYDVLPKFEVRVQDQGRDPRREATAAPVEKPGAYVLQVGSYRNAADAERLRAKVAKLGIEARVQRVAIDTDALHRVLIGPFRDLGKLNSTRQELRAADIDAIVIPLGE